MFSMLFQQVKFYVISVNNLLRLFSIFLKSFQFFIFLK